MLVAVIVRELRAAYEAALASGADVFVYAGREWYTPYAAHVLRAFDCDVGRSPAE